MLSALDGFINKDNEKEISQLFKWDSKFRTHWELLPYLFTWVRTIAISWCSKVVIGWYNKKDSALTITMYQNYKLKKIIASICTPMFLLPSTRISLMSILIITPCFVFTGNDIWSLLFYRFKGHRYGTCIFHLFCQAEMTFWEGHLHFFNSFISQVQRHLTAK